MASLRNSTIITAHFRKEVFEKKKSRAHQNKRRVPSIILDPVVQTSEFITMKFGLHLSGSVNSISI